MGAPRERDIEGTELGAGPDLVVPYDDAIIIDPEIVTEDPPAMVVPHRGPPNPEMEDLSPTR